MSGDPLTLAQGVAALGVTGLLALGIILFMAGKLRRESELLDAEKEHAASLAFRESLRQEAITDRKASDERLTQFLTVMKENNDLTRRSLELNERLVEEFVRPSSSRTRRTDRGPAQR